jgi:hypothetical protein
VTVDGVWIDDWFHGTPVTRNYNYCGAITLQFTAARTKFSQSSVSSAMFYASMFMFTASFLLFCHLKTQLTSHQLSHLKKTLLGWGRLTPTPCSSVFNYLKCTLFL